MMQIKQNDDGIGIKAQLSTQDGALNFDDVDTVHFIFNGHTITSDVHDGYVLTTLEKHHTSSIGFFNAEYKVFYTDGRVETFPNSGYLKVNVVKELRRGTDE